LFQRDYMMRMIEQFTAMLAQVMFKRRNQNFAEAMELLTQAMKQLLGLNSKLVLAFSVKDLVALLSTQGQFDAAKGLLLSDMLKAEGELLLDEADGNTEVNEADGNGEQAVRCYLKALELLLEMRWMNEAAEAQEEVEDRLASLLLIIKPAIMPARLVKLLMEYYDNTGKLAKAEDMLFFLLNREADHMDWLDAGLQMLERWQIKQFVELEQGGLSSAEVTESYELLLKMKQTASEIDRM
jgi:tetratricopeptide (TPR) repeat protein